jgi:hypothetical protein
MRTQRLLLLILAVLFSRVVVAQDTSIESKVIEKVELLGGHVEMNDKLPGSPIVGISFEGSQRFDDK